MNYLGNIHKKFWTQHSNRWTDDNNNYQSTLAELKHKKPYEFLQENRQAIKENNYEQLIGSVENVTQKLNNGFEMYMIQLRYEKEKVHGQSLYWISILSPEI